MAVDLDSVTSLTLLRRLREQPDDKLGWDEFVARYGPKVHRWCLRWGLQEPDADDVTQNVMLALSKQMRTFRYDPSGRFRRWLKTIAHRAWCDFLASRRRALVSLGDSDEADRLLSDAAREDFLRGLEDECDREILELAMSRVKPRVQPHTWQAWERTALDHIPAADVARELGVREGSVYMARSRVQRMLLQEAERLDAE